MTKAKRIAVTGAHGKVGKVLVPHLQSMGYEVFSIDRDDPHNLEESYIKANLEDFGQALDALSSVGSDVYARAERQAFDTVIHLASDAHPRMTPDSNEFQRNLMSTFNVFESCKRLGIKNIVWSSSEVATGVPYDKTEHPYVPVDEDYPLRGFHVYGLTKVLGEEMAKQFCLNNPELRITCLRLSNVIDPEEYTKFDGWQDTPTKRMWNFWTYIDNRDAAHSIECAIRYEKRGKDEFFICNDDTVMLKNSKTLLEEHFPYITYKEEITGNGCIISNKKAKEVLGFQPKYNWSDGKEA